jgi:hypothetical protein
MFNELVLGEERVVEKSLRSPLKLKGITGLGTRKIKQVVENRQVVNLFGQTVSTLVWADVEYIE